MQELSIQACEVPHDSLLYRYSLQPQGFTDCYVTSIPVDVDLQDYVRAFYSSWVFRPERLLISIFLRLPGSRLDLEKLADGTSENFSAWSVEARRDNEIILADLSGATRSWLRVSEAREPEGKTEVALRFGSAVLPRYDQDGNPRSPSLVFRLLSGFHVVYSRMLLKAARDRLLKTSDQAET